MTEKCSEGIKAEAAISLPPYSMGQRVFQTSPDSRNGKWTSSVNGTSAKETSPGEVATGRCHLLEAITVAIYHFGVSVCGL